MTVSGEAFLAQAQAALTRVGASQTAEVAKAADLLVASLRAGGVVHAFGSGHSEALAMEIAGRAGGLVPSNRLAVRDLVMHGGESAELLQDPKLERDPSIAHQIYQLAPVEPADCFVIASNSGINGCVVELASLVKERGHGLIVITSTEQSAKLPSRHPSGRRLADVADVVLDNGAPYGDAALPLPDGNGAVCAVSSITGALLAQMITAEVVRRLLATGHTPPVYLSANVPGGDEHNHALESRYAGRIRRTA